MLLRECSDLHTEAWNFNKLERMLLAKIPPMERDHETVLVLPGDIGTFARYPSTIGPVLERLAARFRHVVYVMGNHEWYNSCVWGAERQFWACRQLPPNVTVLEDSHLLLDDVLFIGATLWTDFDCMDPLAMEIAAGGMNDFHVIRTGGRIDADSWMLRRMPVLRPELTVRRHQASRRYIFDTLCSFMQSYGNTLKTVVATHHLPSSLSVAPEYHGSPLNHAFFSELSEEIILCGPDIWFHGHTHKKFDYPLGGTRVICNAFGYHDYEENKEYDPFFAVEL